MCIVFAMNCAGLIASVIYPSRTVRAKQLTILPCLGRFANHTRVFNMAALCLTYIVSVNDSRALRLMVLIATRQNLALDYFQLFRSCSTLYFILVRVVCF